MISEVIRVGSVDDNRETPLLANALQTRIQLALAEETALMRVLRVTRISQLFGASHHVFDSKLFS
jgi:hypothetical protein